MALKLMNLNHCSSSSLNFYKTIKRNGLMKKLKFNGAYQRTLSLHPQTPCFFHNTKDARHQ